MGQMNAQATPVMLPIRKTTVAEAKAWNHLLV